MTDSPSAPRPLLPRASALPDFPWDSLRPYRAVAAAHPDGVVDLAIGTPVDDSPDVARAALTAASNAPGYPATIGTPAVREAIIGWMERRRGVRDLSDDAVIPTIGSKESVALLPLQLGAGPGDVVVHPRAAYPTYDVGARLAGAAPVPVDTDADPDSWELPAGPDGAPAVPVIVWLNSPGNPDGHVLGVEQLARIVAWARRRGAVVIADECYAELGWAEPWASEGVPSLLDARAAGRTGGTTDLTGLIVLYSLSKQSNLAGYRAAFLAGDPELVKAVTEVRKHSGLLVPAPVQAAMVAALNDDAHVAAQRETYRRRREALLEATAAVGLTNDPASVAGLYLWLKGPDSMSTDLLVGAFAELGIVVAPGDFYGEAGAGRVRMSLTGTDEHVAAACERLRSSRARDLFS